MLELADELGEYCGKVLAGLGADVIKVEPKGGESTRAYGPFYQDQPDPERSLYFWHYNFGKRGITLDLDSVDGQSEFRRMSAQADIILETRPRGYFDERGLSYESIRKVNPGLIAARISAFGDSGPWADYKGSDLVHLALGGVMMNTGYDPEPSGFYETPPIAPQMWHAYHIAGEYMAIAAVTALVARRRSGLGQQLSCAVHAGVALNTELDTPDWIYARIERLRLTCRASDFKPSPAWLAMSKDGRWLIPSLIYATTGGRFEKMVEFLDSYGMADDLKDDKYLDAAYRTQPSVGRHLADVVARFVVRFEYSHEIWRAGQEAGLLWAPERKPEENLTDPHWSQRETFFEVEHPEFQQTFVHVGAKWMAPEVPWRRGPRAPHVGEHNAEVRAELDTSPRMNGISPATDSAAPRKSALGKPFGLTGVRVVDMTWQVASAGGGRFLACQGAEVIKVEHKSRWDTMRFTHAQVPIGLRDERDHAGAPILMPRPTSPNRSGTFMDINAGKRSISLNVSVPRGKELLGKLIERSDVVTDGFSPGTLNRMGFGYQRLKELNRSIVYVQQSGLGEIGIYGRMRTAGPIAAAFAGLSEMSGLPEPYPPAGIGYSYLDWIGAYNLALAVLVGLYRRDVTKQGCWIDSSQVECGTYLNGTAILDYSANGRGWARFGNRSPYRAAAPHGAYRTAGEDRWIAIACFSDDEWQGLTRTLGAAALTKDVRFTSLESRLANQDALDSLVEDATRECDGYDLMHQLQHAGVPAGVCQTARDRVDHDPQLRHLQWLPEVTQSEIGRWPVRGFPVEFTETPAYMGGIADRHGPSYGEDNSYVYGEILGLSSAAIRELEEQGVI